MVPPSLTLLVLFMVVDMEFVTHFHEIVLQEGQRVVVNDEGRDIREQSQRGKDLILDSDFFCIRFQPASSTSVDKDGIFL